MDACHHQVGNIGQVVHSEKELMETGPCTQQGCLDSKPVLLDLKFAGVVLVGFDDVRVEHRVDIPVSEDGGLRVELLLLV